MSISETIFSLFLVCLIAILVSNVYPSSMLSVRHSEHRVLAANLAQSTLEECLQRPFNELETGIHPLPKRQEAGVTFTRSLEVLSDANVDTQLLKGYRVTVEWRFRDQQRHLTHERWRARVEQ